MKFVDVTNDIAFRKIFGNENKKISLISFLNAVLAFPEGKKVVDVDILNPYQLPNLHDGKTTIVDVKARDKNGNSFIIEMQVSESPYFSKRVLYYTSQSYISQIESGKNYSKLNPAYFIGILEFEIGNNPNYKSTHKVLDVETGEHIIQDVEFNFIELPKFNKTETELTSVIDQWVYFIKNAENLKVIPEKVTDIGLKEAYLEAEKHNWTQAELDDYLRASIKEGDEMLKIEVAQQKLKEAEERGQERGQIKGIEKGIEKGKTEEQIKFVFNADKMGLSIDNIIKLTELTKTEIENILKK